MNLLKQLTTTGMIDEGFFRERLANIDGSNTHLIVGVETKTGNVLTAGTLVIEPKFIHECGLVGHIEDVVVERSMRRKRIGQHLVRKLCNMAQEGGCYKIILD